MVTEPHDYLYRTFCSWLWLRNKLAKSSSSENMEEPWNLGIISCWAVAIGQVLETYSLIWDWRPGADLFTTWLEIQADVSRFSILPRSSCHIIMQAMQSCSACKRQAGVDQMQFRVKEEVNKSISLPRSTRKEWGIDTISILVAHCCLGSTGITCLYTRERRNITGTATNLW